LAIKSSKETLTSAWFLAPFLSLFTLFIIVPIFYAFYLSFRGAPTSFDLSSFRMVGLKNYARILQDWNFWSSLGVTCLYALINIPIGITASLALALLLNNKLPGKSIYRGAFFLPNVLDMLVVGVIWSLIYAPKYGALAQIVSFFFGPENFFNTTGVLGSPYTALLGVILAMTLKGAGFGMILFLAALQNIPADVYEAADIDGATKWEQFKHITFPMLRPITIFMVITGITSSLNAFTEIYAMTSGGPQISVMGKAVGSTSVSGYYLYKQFEAGEYGYAAAISFVLLLITLTLTFAKRAYDNRQIKGKKAAK